MAIPGPQQRITPPLSSASVAAQPPRFHIILGDLRTGTVFSRPGAVSAQWQQAPLNDAGTLSTVVQASDLGEEYLDLYHTGAAGRAYLAIAYDRTILNAGPIWTSSYQRSTGQVTLNASGLWSYFDHRKVMPLLTEPFVTSPPGGAGSVQSVAGLSTFDANMTLTDIAKALLQQAESHVGGNLPLIYPARQGQYPSAIRNYHGYELKVLGDMLKELTGVEGGPDIGFVPSYTDQTQTAIQWTMIAGSPSNPMVTQSGADWFFDMTVPVSPVVDVQYNVDATSMATRTWVTGAGSSETLLMSQADSTQLTAAGYPLLEVEQAYSNVSIQGTLDNHARKLLTTNNRPSAVWKLYLRDDGGLADGTLAVPPSPRLGEYAPGDWAQIVTGNSDPYLPQGQRRARIHLVEGDLSFTHSVTCFGEDAEV